MRPPTPHSKLAIAAEIGAGVVALVAFCALAGGASPTIAVHRRARVARSMALPTASASPSAIASTPIEPVAITSAVPSSSVVAAAASIVPVHGHRARAGDPGGGAGAPDLDGARVRIEQGTRVLVFGDSMVDAGFAQHLGALVKARGGTLEADGWTSSTTARWASEDRLARLLERVNPDVVFIALGSNECFLGDPTKAAPQVEAIVAQLRGRACVWVGPPVWKGETGIVSVEREHSAPCAFYDSGNLEIERWQDGIHPTPKGGARWADAVWKAAVEASATPVLAGTR